MTYVGAMPKASWKIRGRPQMRAQALALPP
jgi:hypothetical protein